MNYTNTLKSILTVTWEGEPWRSIHISIFGKNPSLPKQNSTLEEFEKEFTKIEYRLAKAYAIKRLAAMSMPSSTLEQSLKKKLVSIDTIDKILRELESLGYLNDEEWIKSFVRVQLRKKRGPKAILAKLAAKGLPSETIEEHAKQLVVEQDQTSVIQDLLKTKYKHKNLSDYREKQKVLASLVRRGYDISDIIEALRL
jgi:regulatory protein